MTQKKNVIILTSGLSGSSVLTGLIARAGYWTGLSTFRKTEYETHENESLIALNQRLFREADYLGNYLIEFSSAAMERLATLPSRIDCEPYRAFKFECDRHEPWVWKDPRLWLTIRFWRNLLDLEKCAFILLTRAPMQSWISSTLRKQITTYRYSRRYEEQIQNSIVHFLEENRLAYLHLRYEELIQHPSATIKRMNAHLGIELTVDDLKATYHKPLYKNPRNSWVKHFKALLIYIKNYSQRLDIAAESE